MADSRMPIISSAFSIRNRLDAVIVILWPIVFSFIVKTAKRGQQCLIRYDGDITRFMDIGRDNTIVLFLKERGSDPLLPLVLDGIRRAEDQRRPIQTRNDLDAQRGFSCTRSRHHVKLVVTQVKVQVIQNPFLVTSPFSVELKNTIGHRSRDLNECFLYTKITH